MKHKIISLCSKLFIPRERMVNVMKIGVTGSAVSSDDSVLQKAKRVGEEIALRGCYLLTGATTGIPYEAASPKDFFIWPIEWDLKS